MFNCNHIASEGELFRKVLGTEWNNWHPYIQARFENPQLFLLVEQAYLLLEGQRLIHSHLLSTSFQLKYSTIDKALQNLLCVQLHK